MARYPQAAGFAGNVSARQDGGEKKRRAAVKATPQSPHPNLPPQGGKEHIGADHSHTRQLAGPCPRKAGEGQDGGAQTE